MYAFSVAGFVTLGVCDKWRNCPSFWASSSSRQPFRFCFSDQHSRARLEPKWRPVPDSVLMCLAVSYGEFRSLEWWQSRVGWRRGSHAHRHGWRILWRHREERSKTQLFFPPKFSLVKLSASPNTATVVIFNMLWLQLYCMGQQRGSFIKYYYSPVMLTEKRNWQGGRLTFSLWKEWRKFPLSSPSSLGVPGGLLMPLKLFGEFWRRRVCNVIFF